MHRVTPLPPRDLPEYCASYVGSPRSEHHSKGQLPSGGADLNQRVLDALTDLLAYALSLDIEYDLLDRRVEEFTREQRPAVDLRSLLRERAELAEEREEFRGAIASFREQLLPH